MISLRRLLTEAARCVLAGPSLGSMWRRLAFAPLRLWLTNPRRALLFVAVRPYTMLPYKRLAKLAELADECNRLNVPGAFVECGTYRGGSAAILATIGAQRPVHVFDSFQGCPTPREVDISRNGRLGQEGEACADEAWISQLFLALGLRGNIHSGWFSDSVPQAKRDVGPIALLHLDCDWYASVRVCLECLWSSVVRGGFIIIDDVFYWRGAEISLREFYARKGTPLHIVRTDRSGGWIRKE